MANNTAGNRGAATSRGVSSVGKNGVAVARGDGIKVKGGVGSILVIVQENFFTHRIESWKAFQIDGDRYKPDVWYTLDNGEVVECDDLKESAE